MTSDRVRTFFLCRCKSTIKSNTRQKNSGSRKKGVETTTSQAPLLHQKYLYLGYYRL